MAKTKGKKKEVEVKPVIVKVEEKHTVSLGDYVLVVKIDARNKGRITLEKPDNVQSAHQYGQKNGKRDYHFEDSAAETVEKFALCALEAVRLSREAYKPDAESEKK